MWSTVYTRFVNNYVAYLIDNILYCMNNASEYSIYDILKVCIDCKFEFDIISHSELEEIANLNKVIYNDVCYSYIKEFIDFCAKHHRYLIDVGFFYQERFAIVNDLTRNRYGIDISNLYTRDELVV